MPFSRVMS